MKFRLEITDDDETEIIIKCHKLTPDIIKLQQILISFDTDSCCLSQIVLYKSDTEYYMNLSDILFFQTESSIIYAHTATDAYETKYKLYELEEILPAAFIRISKSAIVNSSLIYSIQRNLAASSVISFYNTHKEVYVSRAYYKMLKNKMDERRFHTLQ
ncbi:LytTR family transcriptional regulator [Eubacterium sp. MSJ-13]|uniref:LytTR family DNA-binding domain-containing protein n=1 Tax=Eubacterium sp. MSJ-13 TaxID=2841513 RepID=UPI001C10BCEA|nr:LytTR family DNA-binding domain-containing protein [Eubacterium sp. MSJ-13]MBU5479343.1 LytTR family transcriptional regulator [Eubacterium sp. MSJ-13]